MNDQNILSQEDALAAMKGQLGESSNDTTATTNPSVGVTTPKTRAKKAYPVANQSVALTPLDQRKVVRVFEDISNYMGDFFNSLKPVDAHFAQLADEEYAKARQLASKENLTEQEFDDMMVNILSAITITGVGEMFKTIQTAQALNEVKKILREEARQKLKLFKKTKKSMSTIYEAANERFQEVSQNLDDPDDIYEKFCALRTAMYNDSLLEFLIATYEAANENKFQGEFNYPVLFFLNQSFLYNWILCIDEKTSSDEVTLNTRRKYIKRFVEKIERTITDNLTPTPEEIVFAKDPGLMAVAIHDYNPYETIGYTDDGDEVGVDSNSLHPDCADELRIFWDLYKVGDANSTQSDLANSLVQNKSLEEGALHILNLFSVSMDYQKRMLLVNINIILGGILGFVVSMAYGLKWYWSLGIGVVCCVLMAKASREKTITRKFMKKLNYVERAIRMTALNNGGYTEPINLQQIDVNNKSGCLLAVIGFLIGCIGGPIGAIVGALVGFGISKFLNSEEKPNNEYDYDSVSTGKAWKGYIVTAILVIGIIAGILRWIAPSSGLRSVFGSDKSSTEVVEAGYAENGATEIVVAEEAVAPTSRREEIANEAEKALYIIYCHSENETNNMAEYGEPIYSEHFKNKYKELGITEKESRRLAGSSGYTKAFDQLLNDVSKAESETDMPVILDCDILFESQETPCNFDLIINSIDVTDENNVTIEALMKEFSDARWARKYVLKRENGVFKIDDIIDDDGISTRKSLEEEIKLAYNSNGNEVMDNTGDHLKLSGKVGEFSVVFLLSISGDEVSGRYAYQSSLNKYGDKPENYLYFSGYLTDGNEMNLTARQYNKDEIHEYINLKVSGTSLSGTIRNANNGDVLPLELKVE